MTSHDWEKSAACREVDAELWFPGYGQSPRAALDICWRCPARVPCLEAAMAEEHPANRRHSGRYGVRGGLTADERAQLQRRRTIAAARGTTTLTKP